MAQKFALCDKLLGAYRSLAYDRRAQYQTSFVPGYIYWPDEHPYDISNIDCHESCYESILRLIYARVHYWECGSFPDELVCVWDEAELAIPEWPGFKRLTLNEEEKKALAESRQAEKEYFDDAETGDLDVKTSFRAGGLIYEERLFRLSKAHERKKAPWWKFW